MTLPYEGAIISACLPLLRELRLARTHYLNESKEANGSFVIAWDQRYSKEAITVAAQTPDELAPVKQTQQEISKADQNKHLRNLIHQQERIKQANRNILQYAASIAGVWSIIGGTDGVLALAQGRGGLPIMVDLYYQNSVGLAILATTLLGVALYRNYRVRSRSEEQWHIELDYVDLHSLMEIYKSPD